MKIAWYGKHFGEEPPLVGNSSSFPKKRYGAGTIFFSDCNLCCVFCQNYQISQGKIGKEYSTRELADIMLGLQEDGAANLDLVTPTLWSRSLKDAIILARDEGLVIPVIWNSNAYEKLRIIEEMEGLVDIYLPDFKYVDDRLAMKYSNAPNYCKLAEEAIKEMYRQVGYLVVKNGIAQKGLIVRHLILPGCIDDSVGVLTKIAGIDKNIHVSLMSQYYPAYRSYEFPEIDRRLTCDEVKYVSEKRMELGLGKGWTQGIDSGEMFFPDFRKKNPFDSHTEPQSTQRI
jgi:putative pyruvate formate lyase activating enzyme